MSLGCKSFSVGSAPRIPHDYGTVNPSFLSRLLFHSRLLQMRGEVRLYYNCIAQLQEGPRNINHVKNHSKS